MALQTYQYALAVPAMQILPELADMEVDTKTFETAKKWLGFFMQAGFSYPDRTMAMEGGILLGWRFGKGSFSLEILPDGTLLWFFRDKTEGKEENYSIETEWADSVPTSILANFPKFV